MIKAHKRVNRYNEIIPLMIWTSIFVLPFLLRIILFRHDPRTGSLTNIFFSFITIILLFYLHTYVIYPLLRKPYGKWLYAMAIAGCAALFLVSMNYFMHDLSAVAEAHNLPNIPGPRNPARLALVFPFALVIFCSFSYRNHIEKIKQNERIREMETSHLKTELDFLRSQVSPHFMFNLMNTLVSMARKRSELMEPSLISLSQLMRYMLYDSSDEKIALQKELEYLKNYINLQLLRFGDTIRFNLFLSGDPEGYAIEPMLLIPFVENAFKHGVDSIAEPFIEVSIDVERTGLRMRVSNNVSRVKRRNSGNSGIGLANVGRRLALLYPKHHRLTVTEEEELYIVNLEINL